jgi:uncharacterized protein with PIN domain
MGRSNVTGDARMLSDGERLLRINGYLKLAESKVEEEIKTCTNICHIILTSQGSVYSQNV